MTTRALTASTRPASTLPHWTARMIAGALGALSLQGCITLQAIEPVIDPPQQFKSDVTVPVEFAVPGTIGFRCAERGATFLGLPGITAGACADRELVTMLDPCLTVTAGAYAAILCEGVRLRREQANLAPPVVHTAAPQPPAGLVKASYAAAPARAARAEPPARKLSDWDNVLIEFVEPAAVEMRCAERGAKMAEAEGGSMACADHLLLTVANPCTASAQSWYTRTLCHELAHANGWPADHPAHYHAAVLKPASQSPQALALAAREPLHAAAPAAPVAQAAPVAPAAPAFTPSDLPAGMRQLVADLVVHGLAAGARAPDALIAQLRLAAWMVTPPTATDRAVADRRHAALVSGAGPAAPAAQLRPEEASPTLTLTPLRGRRFAGLAAGASASLLAQAMD